MSFEPNAAVFSDDALDYLDYDDGTIEDDTEIRDVLAEHGFDSRFTPVDTLMSAPVQMHLDYADDMMFGQYA